MCTHRTAVSVQHTVELFVVSRQREVSFDWLLCLHCIGFEGCSMVPSIYPLETLHNSLSLKQVDEFLGTMCESSSEAHAKTMKGMYV